MHWPWAVKKYTNDSIGTWPWNLNSLSLGYIHPYTPSFRIVYSFSSLSKNTNQTLNLCYSSQSSLIMERGWSWPPMNFVKVNVHAVSLAHRLPNGNDFGIGVVIRDHMGTIVKMYSGTIRNRTRRGNELWSLIVGLRGAFLEGEDMVILETDNADGVKEWEDWRWYLDPNNRGLIQQLEQRKRDPNLEHRVNVISASENRLARYLAYDGAEKRTCLVVYRRMFGRVRQLWMLDMGIGPIEGDFGALTEDEYDELMMDEAEENDAIVQISDEGSNAEAIVEGIPAAQEME